MRRAPCARVTSNPDEPGSSSQPPPPATFVLVLRAPFEVAFALFVTRATRVLNTQRHSLLPGRVTA